MFNIVKNLYEFQQKYKLAEVICYAKNVYHIFLYYL